MTAKLKLTYTRAALEVFNREEPAREALLLSAKTNAEVSTWQAIENLAILTVRKAFYADTCDRNSRENCMLVDVKWLRELVARNSDESETGASA